jgi:hypothetical protein
LLLCVRTRVSFVWRDERVGVFQVAGWQVEVMIYD